MKAVLALADGKLFWGESFGAPVEGAGEVVFNTSMCGYQEVITDPSYCGQMVVMTYPLIGNYGINLEDYESARPWLGGFIIKELSGIASNWRSRKTLNEFFLEYNIPGIQGIDTRALTRHIRDRGEQQGIISTNTADPQALVKRAQAAPGIAGRDLVREVTCQTAYDWVEGEWDLERGFAESPDPGSPPSGKRCFVIAYDLGIKLNILRKLTRAGCRVRVVPADTSWEEVLAMKPDGVFLSNGPGDPAAVTGTIENIRSLVGKVPVFGICLGHQILSLALGARTYKLKFGHHGGNQPVMDLNLRKVEITAQNHGFAVIDESVPEDLEISSINLNDRTVEGIKHKNLPVFSVQYHPEASPGPHDSSYLFNTFVELMKKADGEREAGSVD